MKNRFNLIAFFLGGHYSRNAFACMREAAAAAEAFYVKT